MKILAVSYASIGYGSGQIPSMMKYFQSIFNSECYIIEPDQIERPLTKNPDKIIIKRILNTFHPFSPEGRIEYILEASKMIDEIEPDLLILFTSYTLPVLFKIKNKPKKVIYYYLETMPDLADEIEINKKAGSMVDLIIFPEENRAAKFLELTRLRKPFCIVYNSTNPKKTEFVDEESRNGKIIYSGGLHEDAGSEFFLNKKTQTFPIDLYGLIEADTIEKKEILISKFQNLSNNVRYHGYVPQDELEKIRQKYSFSTVIWLPTSENNIYACPNKFFESIANGVPPITTPHPQTKLICQRYNCGIVMEDATYGTFLKTLRYVIKMESSEYKDLVNNCKKAVQRELNWEDQMSKVINRLGLTR